MKKQFYISAILLITVICFSQFTSLSYAQSEEYEDYTTNNNNNIQLFVPEKMIAGELYHGMVTLLSPSPNNSLVLLSVDDDFVVQIDSSVNIQTNKNHGTFKITPLNEGEATVSILYDGELLSANTKVFSKKSDAQKLKIILPTNSTITANMKGMVFLLDGNDSPIPSTFDRIISLIPSEKIFTPNSVTIQNRSSYSIFDVIIQATGEITAIAPQLESHTIPIEKSQEIIDVKIGIAPNIILPESYTNYFIWLEKDGLPYTIQGVQKVEIQSSNVDVVRLGVSPASYKNENSIIISMNDGMAKGRLYTGSIGAAEIFVSMDNYGHASSVVHVGATILSDNSNNLSVEDYTDKYTDSDINHIQFWVYPDITDDYAYGVASLYHAEQTEEIKITVDENDVQISNVIEQTVLIPVIPSASTIYATINEQDVEVLMRDVATTTQIKQVPKESSTTSDHTADGPASTSSNISTSTFLTATRTGIMYVNLDFKVGGSVDFTMDSAYTGGFTEHTSCTINYSTERLNRSCNIGNMPSNPGSISNMVSLTAEHQEQLTTALNNGQVSQIAVEVDIVKNMQYVDTILIRTSNSAEAFITSTFSEARFSANNQVYITYPLTAISENIAIPVTVGDMMEFVVRVNLEVSGAPVPSGEDARYSSYVQATTEFGGGVITVGMS